MPAFVILFLYAVFPAQVSADSAGRTIAPLTQAGARFAVGAMLNGKARVRLTIDTGAGFLVISPETAVKLGYKNLDKAPRFPLATASGVAWARLVAFDTVKIGNITAHNVEGAVLPGSTGLLGQSFLSRFTYTINSKRKTFTLEPPATVPPVYGGADEALWKARFSRLASVISRFEAYRRARMALMRRPGATATAPRRFTDEDIASVIKFYNRLYNALERQADSAGAPDSWRVYP